MFGVGIPPTKFEPRLISVGLNKDFSTIIHFKNPFKESINVTITMEAQVQSQLKNKCANINFMDRVIIKKYSSYLLKQRKIQMKKQSFKSQE